MFTKEFGDFFIRLTWLNWEVKLGLGIYMLGFLITLYFQIRRWIREGGDKGDIGFYPVIWPFFLALISLGFVLEVFCGIVYKLYVTFDTRLEKAREEYIELQKEKGPKDA